MRVTVNGPTHRAGCSRPGLEPGQPAHNQPPHETVDGHAGIRPDQAGFACLDMRRAGPDDEPADATIADEHVRASAEHGDSHACLMRHPKRRDQLPGAARLEENVGGSAHLERGQRGERHVDADPVRTKLANERMNERRGGHDLSIARSCAMSALIASTWLQRANSIQSPGASCPASARSEAITTAITG